MSSPRVLIVRFSAIGDCVMAAWAATSIREKWPDAFLCWAVEGRCAPVVDRHALVTQRIEFPRDRWKQARWSPATWREQIQKYTRLRQLRFDLGFDLQGHSKTALCLRIAAPSHRIAAHATDGFAGRLNPIAGAIPPGTHTVDWNHEVLNRLDNIPACALPRLPDVSPHPEDNLVTISVSAGAAEKVYPLGHWEQIATQLIADGFRVVFLGGRPDPHPTVGEDLVGKLRLKETLRMVSSSRVHLCADTGTGHMAAAVGVPVISVFGPTDPQRFRPYTSNGQVLKVSDRPADVPVDTVLQSFRQVVARG